MNDLQLILALAEGSTTANTLQHIAKIARARLAQPEQEPVAWLDPWTQRSVTLDYDAHGNRGVPLYIAPQPAAQPDVAQCDGGTCGLGGYCDNCPKQAQPVPLTDEQIEDIRQKIFSTGNPYCPVDNQAMRKAARAIEAAHGIGRKP